MESSIVDAEATCNMEEIIRAAKSANAHDFISGMPLSYDTQVGKNEHLVIMVKKKDVIENYLTEKFPDNCTKIRESHNACMPHNQVRFYENTFIWLVEVITLKLKKIKEL